MGIRNQFYRWMKVSLGIPEGANLSWFLTIVKVFLFPWEAFRYFTNLTEPVKVDFTADTVEIWGVRMTREFILDLPNRELKGNNRRTL